MERIPVVEIVQIDGVENGAIVITADGLADGGARFVFVNVSCNGSVEAGNGFRSELGGVLFHPCFGLHIGRLGVDERKERTAIHAKAIKNHLVIAHAAAGVVRMKFAGSLERGFLPETGKVKNAEWASGAAADGGYDRIAHSMV